MATPASYSNPARETSAIGDLKLANAYQEGHDADIPSTTTGANNIDGKVESAIDLEKGGQSHVGSTLTDERTSLGDLPAPTGTDDRDPDVVDWDGPDDPKNPLNWTAKRKWSLITVLSFVTLITPLGSSFFAPGVPQVMAAFHESSNTLAAFVVSIYILGFAIGPLFIAPMSELYGRMWIFNLANLAFIIFSVACAVSTNLDMLIAFRFFAGCAGSAPLTIGGGTIADIFPQEQRAGAMAIWSLGPLLGPVVGPVGGGFLVEAKGWRWVFWVLAILGGVFSVLLLFMSRETYHPVLLERKAARLRKETGNPNLRSKLSMNVPPKEVFLRSIFRPMKMLLFSPIVFLMSLYVAVNYGILYLFFTTITYVFEGQYHFSSGSVGLSFLGVGVGLIVGMAAVGILSDKGIKAAQAKGDVKPEHRLPLLLTLPGGISLPIGIFLYGWTTEKNVHWIAPIIGTVFIGLGNLLGMMTIQTYLVDAFTIHAASAIAANTVLRSLFGAMIPLSGLSLYDKLGLGWGNSLLAFISLALIPVPVLFRYYGERIRTKFQVKF